MYVIQFSVAYPGLYFHFPYQHAWLYSVHATLWSQAQNALYLSQTTHRTRTSSRSSQAPLGARDGPNAARYRDTTPGISENPYGIPLVIGEDWKDKSQTVMRLICTQRMVGRALILRRRVGMMCKPAPYLRRYNPCHIPLSCYIPVNLDPPPSVNYSKEQTSKARER